jgi:hypothetical protein
MPAIAKPRRTRADRMDRICEMFRRAASVTAMNDSAVRSEPRPPASSAANSVCAASASAAEVAPARLTPKLNPPGGAGHKTQRDFAHLHRCLQPGESIPQTPSLLDQINCLSRLLAQRPLSLQEEEALRSANDEAPGHEDLADAQVEEDLVL